MRDGSTATILVVDDDPMCCRLMADALELAGHRVEWTTDPVGALRRVRRNGYALLICDVNMPRMLGTTLAALVGRIQPGLRTILVSAFADAEVRADARALGALLLGKPLRAAALAAAVRDVLRDRCSERAVS